MLDLLLNSLLDWFDNLLSGVNIGSLPAELHDVLDIIFQCMSFGISVLANYTHLGYLLILFGIIVVVDGALLTYRVVMWTLRKIPVLGIE